jgi:Protein of unknown function (DUF3073)
MGRGRQKAKHTKVARELKYFSPDTNYNALQRELGSKAPSDEEDFSAYADKYNGVDDDDEGDDAPDELPHVPGEDQRSA